MKPAKLPKYVRRHGKGFRAVIPQYGERHYGPTYPTVADAVGYRDRFLVTRTPDQPLTVQTGFDLLVQDRRQKASRPDTFSYYERTFRYITRPGLGWSPDWPLHNITEDQVERYVARRRRAGVKDSTIFGKDLQVLSAILNLAIRKGRLTRNVVRSVAKPKIRQEPFGYMDPHEIADYVARMRSWSGPHRHDAFPPAFEADVVEFLFLTGVRGGEFARLRRCDLRVGVRQINIDGKNDWRTIPIEDPLLPIARRFAELERGPKDRILTTPRGTTGHRVVERVFRHWQRRFDEPRFHAHCLRHSYGTAMARNGVPPFELAKLMGHTDPRQTLQYYHGAGSGAFPPLTLPPPGSPRAAHRDLGPQGIVRAN